MIGTPEEVVAKITRAPALREIGCRHAQFAVIAR